ncbi:NADPH-quinone reductase [Nocardioides sp. Soil797]|nr:NADPH-quinone reductase [Nocardioides sp. Soil797]
MKVLWVFAHPEPRSLNGSLRDHAVAALEDAGHEVTHSDLYAMGWNPVVTAADFGSDDERLAVGPASARAHEQGSLSPDILAEQNKLQEADVVIIQFPLWWYTMPAILKGWLDRVFVKGFAYGVAHPSLPGRTRRYGEGVLAGKRAMVVTTSGGPGPSLGPRGINGDIDALLFPIQHGALFYVGMEVVPPLLVPAANRLSEDEFDLAAKVLTERVLSIHATDPIPFRSQDAGEYDEQLVLVDAHASGRTDLGIHRRS